MVREHLNLFHPEYFLVVFNNSYSIFVVIRVLHLFLVILDTPETRTYWRNLNGIVSKFFQGFK